MLLHFTLRLSDRSGVNYADASFQFDVAQNLVRLFALIERWWPLLFLLLTRGDSPGG